MRNDTDIKTVAERLGCFPQNLGRKINSGSIKLLEFANILEMYGCELDIKKNHNKKKLLLTSSLVASFRRALS